jgi:hypothetical protein
MPSRQFIVENLATAFLAGEWTPDGLVRRGAQACGRRERWLRLLVRRMQEHFAEGERPDLPALVRFLDADRGFQTAWARQGVGLRRLFWVPDTMAPWPGAPASWNVPALISPAELADWLGLRPAELDWFAGSAGRGRRTPPGPLRHYNHRWLTKANGKARLLEIPKGRLKHLQRRLLHDLLDLIPPHGAAHGYCKGRSIVSYVAPHTGRRIVLHMDLRDFFPSIAAARVRALFRAAGYPLTVARLLTGLCTSTVPADVFDGLRAENARWLTRDCRRRYAAAHLPQGAPTSPALANLCAYRLDCRLTGLARSAGADYTRYADDLVFSGDQELERSIRRFHVRVCCIALEEGFEVHTRKTRFLRQGLRQQVAGVVVNVHPNVARRDFDLLKAILTNCVRHGPQGQNRAGHADFRAHLAGRIGYVGLLNAPRGQRLRRLFEQIDWES